jgi:hypothetical protein
MNEIKSVTLAVTGTVKVYGWDDEQIARTVKNLPSYWRNEEVSCSGDVTAVIDIEEVEEM